jgi:hypothetical protein
MIEIASVIVLALGGATCISAGVFVAFGTGPGLIALGAFCLGAAFIVLRGASRA